MRPTAHPFALTRTSVGLTESHKELISLLAAMAIENYFAETNSADIVDEPDRDEAAR